MGCLDWGEQVALYDDGRGKEAPPIAEGALRAIARQALAMSSSLRAQLHVQSPSLGLLDEWDICALVTAPGFIDDIPQRAAA